MITKGVLGLLRISMGNRETNHNDTVVHLILGVDVPGETSNLDGGIAYRSMRLSLFHPCHHK